MLVQTQTIDQKMQQIALDHLFIETLETRNSDQMDFHEVSVWGVKSALMPAYEAGRHQGRKARLKTKQKALGFTRNPPARRRFIDRHAR